MFYCLVYNYSDLPENVNKLSTTFFIGSMMWWFVAALLWSPHAVPLMESNFLLFGMKEFFQWLIIIDVITLSLQLEIIKPIPST